MLTLEMNTVVLNFLPSASDSINLQIHGLFTEFTSMK